MRNRNVAGAILYRSNGDILLQERSSDAPRFANQISLFGGGLKTDETPLEGLKRELQEELDYQLDPNLDYPIFQQVTYTIEENQEQGMYTVYLVQADESQTLNLHEGKKMFWIAPQEIFGLNLDPVNRPILEKYARRNG